MIHESIQHISAVGSYLCNRGAAAAAAAGIKEAPDKRGADAAC